MYRHKTLSKKDTKTSEVYLIEVNTLKGFFEEKYQSNRLNTCFHPCPEAKKNEILDKAKGKKRKNAEWFLSLQLDMFGDSQDADIKYNNSKKTVFSLLSENEGDVVIGETDKGSVFFDVERNSTGESFAIIPESLLQNLDNDTLIDIKRIVAEKNNKGKVFLSKEVSFDLARLVLDPEKNKFVRGIVSSFEFDIISKKLSISLNNKIVNSAIKKIGNTHGIKSKYISCGEFLEGSICNIDFYVKNNSIIFLPVNLKKDSVPLIISSSILLFIETGNIKYLSVVSDDVFKKTCEGVDLGF